MKKAILLCGMLLAASATFASAAGLNLAWNNCYADGGVQNRTSACTSNLGQAGSLIGSFFSPADVIEVSGAEIVVDLSSASPALPAWWQFKNVGSCRPTSLAIQAFDGLSCFDWAAGQASMNIAAYQLGLHGPNSARILCVNAVPASAYGTLDQVNEFTAMRLNVNNALSTGTGACDGCLDPVCIVFNSLNMTTNNNANNTKILNPADGVASNMAFWQGGAVPNCTLVVPTKNQTWGAVKALYR